MYANRPERDRPAPMSLTTSDSTQVFADAAAYTASVPEESSLDREGWRPSGLLEWFAIGQTLLPALLFVPGNQPSRAAIHASAFLVSLVVFFYWYFNRRLAPMAKHRCGALVEPGVSSPGFLDRLERPWRAIFVGSRPLESELRKRAGHYGDRVRIENRGRARRCRGTTERDGSFVRAEPDNRSVVRTVRPHADRGPVVGVPVITSDSGEIPDVLADAGVVVGKVTNRLGRAPWENSSTTPHGSGSCLAAAGRWPLSALRGT
jgi:hypothetical protein